jgi:hypothetical protein
VSEWTSTLTTTNLGVYITNDIHHGDYMLTWDEINLANHLNLWPTSTHESVKPVIDRYLELAERIKQTRLDMDAKAEGREAKP